MKVKIHTKMWPHQREALKFLYSRKVGALFTKMGSGKSKVMIDLIYNKQWKNVLILCPLQVGANWVYQTSIHQPKLSDCVLNVCGDSVKEKTTKLLDWRKKQTSLILVCNYDSIWREPFKNEVLKIKWDAVICDESHRIKAPGSKVSKFLALLAKRTDHRYIMTGTPLGNSPLDIYGQYRFLDPNIFGTNFGNFRDRYAYTRPLDTGVVVVDTKRKNPYKNIDELKEKMYSVAFKVNVEQDLPEVQHVNVQFNISKKAAAYYKQIQKEGVIMLKDKYVQRSNVLGVLMSLQQICSGFIVTKQLDNGRVLETMEIDNHRIQTLENLLDGLRPKEPVVIFTKFTKDIDNISNLLDKMGRTYAEVSGRANELEDFQSGRKTILLANIVSGSDGIDLTRAHYCVYYNHGWSVTNYQQSLKRLHRPGQRHQVVYYYLKASVNGEKSMDDVILDALKRNKDIVEAVVESGL